MFVKSQSSFILFVVPSSIYKHEQSLWTTAVYAAWPGIHYNRNDMVLHIGTPPGTSGRKIKVGPIGKICGENNGHHLYCPGITCIKGLSLDEDLTQMNLFIL